MSDKSENHLRPKQFGYLLSVRTAIVAGVFSALVCALLAADYGRRWADDPLNTEEYIFLRAELAEQPGNQNLRSRLRELDLQLRSEYFRQRKFALTGSWLLLGGVVILMISIKSASTIRRKIPMPEPQAARQDVQTPMTRSARWSVAGLAVLLVGLTFALSACFRTELATLPEPEESESASGQTAGSDIPTDQVVVGPTERPDLAGYPSEEEIAANWHRFRGPGGSGISAYDNIPTSWDGASDEGVLWKTPVPLIGFNSPVVWEDRVFLSGATRLKREVYCFNAEDGTLLWQKDVPGTPESTTEPPKIDEMTGYAAPTTTTDGRRVFAMFGNGDVAAFDFQGVFLWSRSLGIPDNSYGHAASLTTHKSRLLIQFDQGGTPEDGKSRLMALDAASGETVWEVARPVPNSWGTPGLIRHQGQEQLITCGDPWVIAYNPADGSEIWRADCLSGDCGVSHAFANGVVHVGNEYCVWSAIDAGGKGDVTETNILWTAEDGLPDMCSPLVTDEYLFLLATWGELTCFDVKTGEMLWMASDQEETELDSSFTSSPCLVAGRIYLFGDEGTTWILEPGREKVELIAKNELGEDCATSPAFQDGRFYIRGKQHLFCIGGQQ